MTTQVKLAATLASSVIFSCIGFGAPHAQPKISPAYWVTETLEVSDQAAFLNVIKAVPATLQPFGGQYIVLDGKIAPGEGSPPRALQLLRSTAWKRRSSGSTVPRPPRRAPKPKG